MMRYIAIEGIDGSGKTTQVARQAALLCRWQPALVVRTWAYNSKANCFGRIMAALYERPSRWRFLVKPRGIRATMYGFAARSSLSRNAVSPCDVLLSDRSTATAYALHWRALPEWFIRLVEPSLHPELVVLLDLPAGVALERVQRRDGEEECKAIGAVESVRRGYVRVLTDVRPSVLRRTEVVVVDALQSEDDVTNTVFEVIQGWLTARRLA